MTHQDKAMNNLKEVGDDKVVEIPPEVSKSLFARTLTALIDGTGISRSQWATLLDVSMPAISQWLNDKTLPRPENLRSLLLFLEQTDDVSEDLLDEFRRLADRPAEEVTSLASRLGTDTTIGQYMLRPLRNALSQLWTAMPFGEQEDLLRKTLARGRSLISPSDAVSGHQSESAHLRAASILKEAMQQLEADSICLYVADPIFDGNFRLIKGLGVKYHEPLLGPTTLPIEPSFSRFEEDVEFIEDVPNSKLRSSRSHPVLDQLSEDEMLYRDFVGREQIQSCARCQYLVNGKIQAILFINYGQPTSFEESRQDDIHDIFGRLVRLLPDIDDESRVEAASTVLPKLPLQLQQFLAQRASRGVPVLKEALELIITQVLKAFELNPSDTLGTIHTYDRESETLRLAARIGEGPINIPPIVELSSGRGLITWSALRHNTLVVNDIQRSPYRKIYLPFREGTQSEVVIPMFGTELVAVLNLESSRPDAFPERIVRSLAWSANQVAVIWHSFLQLKYRRMLEGLLEARDSRKNSLSKIAETAGRELDVAKCDIWCYDQSRSAFTAAATSYEDSTTDDEPTPRQDGWTARIASERLIVFLRDIETKDSFAALEWKGAGWRTISNADQTQLNPICILEKVSAQLGVPLVVDNVCVGVLWLKYLEPQDPPEAALLRAVEIFARQAGRVIRAA